MPLILHSKKELKYILDTGTAKEAIQCKYKVTVGGLSARTVTYVV